MPWSAPRAASRTCRSTKRSWAGISRHAPSAGLGGGRNRREGWIMNKAVLLGLLLIPGSAWAGTSSENPKEKKGDGLICRDVAETGSRLAGHRVCMTREQWELARR